MLSFQEDDDDDDFISSPIVGNIRKLPIINKNGLKRAKKGEHEWTLNYEDYSEVQAKSIRTTYKYLYLERKSISNPNTNIYRYIYIYIYIYI